MLNISNNYHFKSNLIDKCGIYNYNIIIKHLKGLIFLNKRFNNENLFIAIVVFLSLLILFFLYHFYPYDNGSSVPRAVNGVLDLTNWNFKKDGVVKLDGDWDFYWHKLLTPKDFNKKQVKSGELSFPNIWDGYIVNGKPLTEDGYATFRLRIKVSDLSSIKSIYLPSTDSSSKLWINGKLILTCGTVGTSKATMVPNFAAEYGDFDSNSNILDLVLQVSNFNYYHGGISDSISIGDNSQMRQIENNRLCFDIICFMSALICGIYSAGIFLIRPKNRSALYIALLSLLMTLRPLFYDEFLIYNVFPNFNFEILCDFFIILVFGSQLFLMYLYLKFPKQSFKKFVFISGIIQTSIIIMKIFTNAKFLTFAVPLYQSVLVVDVIYAFIVMLRAVKNKEPQAKILLSGALILFVLTINDTLYQSKIINTGFYTPIGFIVFIVALALIQSIKLSLSYLNEEKLSARLISLDKLKDEFLSNTSHELKTPLTGIIGLAQAMLNGSSGKINDLQQTNLSLIVSSSKRLSNLVNDILDFSKIKNSEITLQKKQVDIKQVVETVIFILKPLTKANVTIKNKIDNSISLIDGDENRIQQIMYNLIGNALKFTEQGSIEISAIEKKDFVFINVADSGIGISEDKLPYIFESFEQADASISRSYGGTGLGLSISKSLAHLHGGDITVLSKLGVGSTFTVSFPLYKGQVKDIVKQQTGLPTEEKHEELLPLITKKLFENNKKSNRYKILLVDDEYINLYVLSGILMPENYNIEIATNGIEALEKINSKMKPDLVILDIMMPKMSGYEVCINIRKRYSLYDLPILMITSKDDVKSITSAFNAGTNDYLSKPFEDTELKARVKTLLELKSKALYALSAEMQLLQSQIKPHFIFNTLNIIIYLCTTDSEKAKELLINFSDYLRNSFNFKNLDELIPLDKEIELVKAYLYIQQTRFIDKINVIYNIDETIYIKIPPLILQPLVENSIKHGFFKSNSKGTIKLIASQNSEGVILIVQDDGDGIEEEKIPLLLEGLISNSGIGLYNVNKRLKSFYGRGLNIESQLGKGTKITIFIPNC